MTTTRSDPDGIDGLADLMQHGQQVFPGGGPDPIDPHLRRRRRRRAGIIAASILVLALLLGGGYVGWALTAGLGDPAETYAAPPPSIPAAAAVELPADGAAAVTIAGAEAYLGPGATGIWASSGAVDQARPIASISKLVTALVILEKHPLADAADPGPTLTFDKADHALYDKYYVMGATIAAMPTGSSMSLHDALATMLIPSACNYAEALAEWAFGSNSAFVAAARSWLAAHGLTGTTLVEPTGMDARNTSTPADLITLGRLAAANPVIAQISATRSLTLAGPGTVVSTNSLLGSDGITGLKTGTLDESGSNLLYTATLDVGTPQPLTIIGVALGGVSKDAVNRSVLALLDSIRAGFHTVQLATEGQVVGSYSTSWGSTAELVLGEGASIFTWSDTPIVVSMQTRTPSTWTDGEVVGEVTWTAGPNTVAVPVEVKGGILPPTAWWRLTHPDELDPLW